MRGRQKPVVGRLAQARNQCPPTVCHVARHAGGSGFTRNKNDVHAVARTGVFSQDVEAARGWDRVERAVADHWHADWEPLRRVVQAHQPWDACLLVCRHARAQELRISSPLGRVHATPRNVVAMERAVSDLAPVHDVLRIQGECELGSVGRRLARLERLEFRGRKRLVPEGHADEVGRQIFGVGVAREHCHGGRVSAGKLDVHVPPAPRAATRARVDVVDHGGTPVVGNSRDPFARNVRPICKRTGPSKPGLRISVAAVEHVLPTCRRNLRRLYVDPHGESSHRDAAARMHLHVGIGAVGAGVEAHEVGGAGAHGIGAPKHIPVHRAVDAVLRLRQFEASRVEGPPSACLSCVGRRTRAQCGTRVQSRGVHRSRDVVSRQAEGTGADAVLRDGLALDKSGVGELGLRKVDHAAKRRQGVLADVRHRCRKGHRFVVSWDLPSHELRLRVALGLHPSTRIAIKGITEVGGEVNDLAS